MCRIVGRLRLTTPAKTSLIVDSLAISIATRALVISIVTSFIRSALLHRRQNVFSLSKVVLAMLVFVESRSALPFLRGTDGQNVFSSSKVVLAMLVFGESKRVGGQTVRSRDCCFMTTTTVGCRCVSWRPLPYCLSS